MSLNCLPEVSTGNLSSFHTGYIVTALDYGFKEGQHFQV